MMPVINPIQAIKMINNPLGFAKSLLSQNPNIKYSEKILEAINLSEKGDTKALEKLANDVCLESGTNAQFVKGFIKNNYNI